jgi:hypothetical protein
MRTSEECLEKARKLVELAEGSKGRVQEQLLTMAKAWMQIAWRVERGWGLDDDEAHRKWLH